MRRANGIIRAQSAEFWAKEMGKEFLRAPGQSARHRSRLWRSAPKLSITHSTPNFFFMSDVFAQDAPRMMLISVMNTAAKGRRNAAPGGNTSPARGRGGGGNAQTLGGV